MLLFLDVISPIPEFFVIEDNKVIIKRKIIANQSDKLSDNIFESYIKMYEETKLRQKLKKVAMTIGPGSYTSLRVGAAFISGLVISKNLSFCPISIDDIIKIKLNKKNNANFGFFISSAKKQNFLCYINEYKKIEYVKLEKDKYSVPKELKIIYYNSDKMKSEIQNLKQFKFSFIEELINNNQKFTFSKNKIIKPIYISNNKILN